MAIEVVKSDIFNKWFLGLRDKKAKAIIDEHIYRITNDDMGKVRNVGGRILEKKIYYGAGYRLYFINKNNVMIFLLCGGDKSTQSKDIKLAQRIAKEIK
ncbi:MAG: type II toxin-antitoxin system RelE/ParE family toxin [Candidatus Margulisbacteria bacterium]|jgi:putative addiction module killer protein|nr:type II toxin-antitoxin system RelE/ParE family toxin [Candidatus Margulisiibacteriota bacterium]